VRCVRPPSARTEDELAADVLPGHVPRVSGAARGGRRGGEGGPPPAAHIGSPVMGPAGDAPRGWVGGWVPTGRPRARAGRVRARHGRAWSTTVYSYFLPMQCVGQRKQLGTPARAGGGKAAGQIVSADRAAAGWPGSNGSKQARTAAHDVGRGGAGGEAVQQKWLLPSRHGL
jgi:hypothetical protein